MNVVGPFSRYSDTLASSSTTSSSGSLSLLDIRDFLSRQWRLIFLVTLLAIGVGVAYLAVAPKRYTAQADMIIDTKRVT